ncbi:MAG: hypothetical protein DMG33_06730 [Acidobacteria bacterium]|nr:MAG: hypothetical protein DMG33_06730 [Acidobacteriota bacterium]
MPTVPRIAIFLVLFGALGYFIWDQLQGQPWTWMQTVGICLMIPGFLLWLTAHIQLGTSFSLTPQARKLVTRGVYSKIRNPIYIFSLVFLTGLALLVRRPLLLALGVVIVPMQIVRARREAAVLEEKFGEEYRQYRARTWF